MNKKIYNITGFDCPNCAAKSERHLAKHNKIESAHIDFNNDRLYISYNDEELSIVEIKEIIKEVEDDEIEISELEVNKEHEHHSFFNKEILFIGLRIAFVIIAIIIGFTILNKPEYFWINFSLFLVALLVISYDVYLETIEHIIHLEEIIDEHLLMTLTSIGAFIVATVTKDLDVYLEALMVMSLFQIGEIIEHFATHKSKKAVMEAVSLRVETANAIRDNKVLKVKPEELTIGDIVIVSTGEAIPTDGVIIEGEGEIDTSSLTGEFIPIKANKDLEIYSGYIVKSGSIKVRVNKLYKDSAVSKVIELISSSGAKKSKADEFVTKFARIYTPIILLISILVAIIGGALTSLWVEWIILGLKMLLVGCPCAIVISVPLAYFASIGLASKNGIVIKGSNYLDSLNELKKVICDKTGTLTKGEFAISKVVSINGNKEELMDALLAAEYLSTHPLAKAIVKGKNTENLVNLTENFTQIPGLGVSIKYKGETVLAGKIELLKKHNIEVNEAIENGTLIYVSKGNRYLGYVLLNDEIKDGAKEMVNLFNKEKVETILLTGDKENNASILANSLGINKYHGNLLPEDKVGYLEKELSPKYVTAFVGDGINDAASIKEADVGFAMGALGSDVAVNSADVILMNDNPIKVYEAYKISKIARHTAIFNILFALIIKFGIEIAALVTSLVGVAQYVPMWLAALADTGITVILVINSLLILSRKISYKRVK